MGDPQVTFCLPEIESLEALEALDPERDWQQFGATRLTWIAQTYLRLRDAGHPVRLSRTAPSEGVVVIEATSRRRLLARGLPSRVLLVAVRADHRAQRYADVEIVQNDQDADDSSVFFVPHWPQPGLVPRDPKRGSRLRTAAFTGHAPNLHPDFQSPRWHDFLASLGIAWRDEVMPWAGQEASYASCRWNDFSEIDALVAVRKRWGDPYPRKPASKLANAWHAGVPAILGPEYAYERLRRSELDFLAVSSFEETMAAVRRLHREPALYDAMVKNGRARFREVCAEAVTRRWASVLFDALVPAARARARRRGLALDRALKQLRYRAARLRRRDNESLR